MDEVHFQAKTESSKIIFERGSYPVDAVQLKVHSGETYCELQLFLQRESSLASQKIHCWNFSVEKEKEMSAARW